MMKSAFLWILLYLAAGVVAQPVTDPGFDDVLSNKLQWALVTTGATGSHKNLSAAVYIPGQGTWTGIYNPGSLTPITTDSKFCVASNSKSFIAGLCLKLAEEGLLDLDIPISTYLETTYPNVNPNITIRQLLSHQSGLFDFYNDATAATLTVYNNNLDSLWSPEAVLSTIGAPGFLPGQSYSYSNTNFLVAQMICSKVTCLPISQLLQEKIFGPLGLNNTIYPGDGLPVFNSPFANNYSSNNSLMLDTAHANGFLSFIQTAGGIWSTAWDMVKWYRDGLFQNTTPDTGWLSQSSRADLRNIEPWSGYGLGIRARNGENGGSLYYHAGAWGYRSYTLYDEETGIVICVLGNKYGQIVKAVADKLLETAYLQLPQKSQDIAIAAILEPQGGFCSTEGDIRMLIANNGSQPWENLTVQTVVGDLLGTISLDVPVNLMPGAIEEVVVHDAWWAPANMDYELKVTVLDTLGYPFFNSRKSKFNLYTGSGLDITSEAFYADFTTTCSTALPIDWTSYQPENVMDWRVSHFAGDGGALCKNNFNDGHSGKPYYFELPPMKLNSAAVAQLEFYYAYAPYPAYADSLEVEISHDCGETWTSLWLSGGNTLMTSPETTNAYLPGAGDWAHIALDLGSPATGPSIIRFKAINKFGNNIWLDNIRVSTSTSSQETYTTQPLFFFPNPVENTAYLNLPASVRAATLLVTDVLGKKVSEKHQLKGQTLIFEKGNLPAGTYFYFVREKNREVAKGTLIII